MRIIGTAEVPYVRRPAAAVTTINLLAEAGRRALADADLAPREIDGIGVASFTLAPDHAVDLAWRLGLTTRWLMDSTLGGVSAIQLLQHARRAIEAGDADTILLVSGDRLDSSDFIELVDGYNSATRDHLAPLPFGGPNSLFALLTQRHMTATGTTRADYGRLVVAQRAWAAENPDAIYGSALALDDYLQSPLIADPLCRYDCVPVVSGANAIIVSARSPNDAVAVRALETLHNPDQQEADGLTTGLALLQNRLWSSAGLGPDDIDLVAAYDDYPAIVLCQLADLGFYDGDPAAFVAEIVEPRRLALNTSGGQLSCGQAGAAGGMHGLVEAVRQLRGHAGARQRDNATRALVTGYGMVAYRYGSSAGATILERA
jgi:acetyl-CoA acetyltransferase